MARPKKNGRRATGIQGKSGYLYIITHNHIIKDGVKTREKQQIILNKCRCLTSI